MHNLWHRHHSPTQPSNSPQINDPLSASKKHGEDQNQWNTIFSAVPCNSGRLCSRLCSASCFLHGSKAASPSIYLSRPSLSALRRTWQEGPGQRNMRLAYYSEIGPLALPLSASGLACLDFAYTCMYVWCCLNSGLALWEWVVFWRLDL